MRRAISAAAAILLIAGPALAQEDGAAAPTGFDLETSEFQFSSELAAQGAEIVPASGAGGSVYGMRLEDEVWLCFLADVPDDQAVRQRVIVGAMGVEAAERSLPNIPVVCILTQ